MHEQKESYRLSLRTRNGSQGRRCGVGFGRSTSTRLYTHTLV